MRIYIFIKLFSYQHFIIILLLISYYNLILLLSFIDYHLLTEYYYSIPIIDQLIILNA